jgi:hypothetical protein
MFFKHTNGSYKRVPIMQNTALPNGINGGMSECRRTTARGTYTNSIPISLQPSITHNKISTAMVIRR